MAEKPPQAERLLLGRFSYLDAAVFLVSEGIAVPLNIAAGEAAVHGDVIAAVIGWGIGLPLAFLGWAIPHWRSRLEPATLYLIQRQTIRWAPVAVLLAFAYVVGPSIYRRAIEQTNPSQLEERLAAPADSNKATALESQKSTLLEWLQKAQRERDEARQERDQLKTQLQTLQTQQPTDPIAQRCAELSRQLVEGGTGFLVGGPSEETKKAIIAAMTMLHCNAPKK